MSDNKENSVENVNNKKSTYFKDSQKRYGEKCKKYTVKFTLNESEKSEQIEKAIAKSGLTANAWIKSAMMEKSEREK